MSHLPIDPNTLPTAEMYKLLIGSIVPRPIALVSSLSANGLGNLAPFSFFNALSSNPPCLMISIGRKKTGEKKDTLRNIEETGEFVVNSSNEWLLHKLVHSAAEYPYGIDEMQKVGLNPLPSVKIRPPRVAEAAVQFECTTYDTVEIGDGSAGSATVIIGRIVYVHVAENIYHEGKILLEPYKPIGRLGGQGYTTIGEISHIPIPPPETA